MNESDADPSIVGAVEKDAQKLVQGAIDAISAAGWDCVVVSVSRRIDVGGVAYAPGASGHAVAPRIFPAMSNEAAALRMLAGKLDELAAKATGVKEIGDSYVHEVSWGGGGE